MATISNERATARPDARVEAAFWREERQAVGFACLVRIVAVIAVAGWVWIEAGLYLGIYYMAMVSLFAVSGALLLWLVQRDRYVPWMKYAFAAVDAILLAYILLAPNPLDPSPVPAPVALRFGNFKYAFLLLLFSAYAFSPGLVIWTGGWLAAAGTAVVLWIATRPGAITWGDVDPQNLSLDEFMNIYLHPEFVVLDVFYRDVVIVLVASGMLAAAVWRLRQLVRRQATSAMERANLARYFSPNIIEDLSHGRLALRSEREQPVGVLFVDIAGFTHLCETLSPAEVMDLLRHFHGRMEHAVFANGGTLDKYIGDAVMATFGTPDTGPDDASNTVRCALAMIRAIGHWNTERAIQGLAPVRVGIGAHYGMCMVGDVGGETRLEFTVIGDTVNVASRLEELSRPMDADVLISQDLADAVAREGNASLLADFKSQPPHDIRGREQPLGLLTWSAPAETLPGQPPKRTTP